MLRVRLSLVRIESDVLVISEVEGYSVSCVRDSFSTVQKQTYMVGGICGAAREYGLIETTSYVSENPYQICMQFLLRMCPATSLKI